MRTTPAAQDDPLFSGIPAEYDSFHAHAFAFRPVEGATVLIESDACCQAMRIGDIAMTGSFRYTAMVFAVALGWWVWGELPDATAWCGIALILASGLYALHRERVRALSARARASQATD